MVPTWASRIGCHDCTSWSRLPLGWEFRLPTEAQWEYSCRAGTTTATAFGDKLGSRQANCNGNDPYNGAAKGPNLERTTKVGSYRPNAWGLHDMHGNVYEFCRDWYHRERADGTDPEATKMATTRVFRGGGWLSTAMVCRSAYRFGYEPGFRSLYLGFRVAAVQVSK